MSWLKSLTSRRRQRAAAATLQAQESSSSSSFVSQGDLFCQPEFEPEAMEQMLCNDTRRRRRRSAQEQEKQQQQQQLNNTLTHCQAQISDNCFYQDDDDEVTSQLVDVTNEQVKQQQQQIATRPQRGGGLKMSPPPTHTCDHVMFLSSSRLIVSLSLFSCLLLLATINVATAATTTTSITTGTRQHFEVEPEAQYHVLLGRDIRLRCLVRNRQGECVWLRNGRVLAPIAKKYAFTRAPEDGDCSLTISNASVSLDDGRWQCQVLSPDLDQDSLQTREVNLVVLVTPEKPQIKNLVSLRMLYNTLDF